VINLDKKKKHKTDSKKHSMHTHVASKNHKPASHSHVDHKPEGHPHTVTKHNTNAKHKKKINKKDLITIIALSALIIVVVIISILFPGNNNPDPIINDTNLSIIDTNVDVNLVIDNEVTIEQFQEMSLNLQLNIFNDVRSIQLSILEPYYTELGLDKDQIDICVQNNDYTAEDMNLENAKIVFKIQKDTMLASLVNITGTPGMYVNSYLVSGAQDHNLVKEVIELALNDPEIDFNFENVTYSSDSEISPKLTIIYNTNSELIQSNYAELETFLTTSEQLTPVIKSFFTSLFENVELVYLDYSSLAAKEYIESLNVQQVPLWYLEGNLSDLEITTDENYSQLFAELFVESPIGGYVFNQQVMFDLITAGNIQPLYQLLAYNELNDVEDYVIGSEDASVTLYLFIDYDCPYCKKLEKETINLLIPEYVDTNKANLVVKDYIVHEMSSLFPSVFSRCAQEQGKYMQTHLKLYELMDVLGQTAVVQPILDSYQKEIDELNLIYQELLAKNQQNAGQLPQ